MGLLWFGGSRGVGFWGSSWGIIAIIQLDLDIPVIVNVTGSRLLSYQKNTWLRTIYCLQIIWQENRKSQWRSWSATILCWEDMVQAGCD